jgi:hypothetical protein
LATVYPGERTSGIHWTKELFWMQRLEEKSFVHARDRTLIIQSIAIFPEFQRSPGNSTF